LTSSGSATSPAAAEPRRRRAAALAAALALAVALPAAGQAPKSSTPVEFELSRSVQQTLARVQELWLQWVGATLQDNRARADEALRGLGVGAREIGFSHLPDLSLGAVAQARQSAAGRNFERARRQLAAAEVLDPGRPETAFAEAAVARTEGSWFRAGWSSARALSRALRGPERFQLVASLGLWLLLVLTVASALFVAFLAARHGREVVRVLVSALSPPLPGWAAAGLVAFLLLGPLALPSGLYLLLMLASALLWTYATTGQRAILAVGWLLAIVTPQVAAAAQRRLSLDHSPPMRAFAAFEQGRLYGGFFSDLQVLRTALPDRPASLELVADVHRTLGQWEVARSIYRRILYDEPSNVPALLNLGAYHFRKGDYAAANAYFEGATRSSRPSAAAWYNLSLGLSDAYLFDESREALSRARSIDAASVDVWIATANPDRVLTFNGSLGRRDELRRELIAAWGGEAGRPRDSRGRWLGVVGVGAALLVALGFDLLRRRTIHAPGARERSEPRSRLGRWLRRLVPAIEQVEAGSGPLAWANLALLAGLLLLPRAFELAGDPPIAGWAGRNVATALAALGGLAYLSVRVRSGWTREEE
jgi:tetratricopeptide (TPR) repeat protein